MQEPTGPRSIEQSLHMIADALDRISMLNPNTTGPAVDTVTETPPPATTGAPDLLPPAKKPGRKKAEPASTVVPAAQPATKPEVTKQDITAVLQNFLKKFPGPEGADKARVFFTNAGAKNITTLDPAKYKVVFLGLSEAAK